MKALVNTTQEALKHMVEVAVDTSIVGPSNAIDLQEFQGQSSFVSSDTLPTDMVAPFGTNADFGETREIARTALETAGVKFLGPVEGDPLFQYVELPIGWNRAQTNHSQLSVLVDDNNRERARIFYKAGYYDRKAALILVGRYGIRELSYFIKEVVGETGPIVREITDGGVVNATSGKTLHRVEVTPVTNGHKDRFRAYREATKQAETWLSANYPEWQNPIAYWD